MRREREPITTHFSHGLGGNREGSAFLGKHWAARGYIAVFLQHPGSDDSVWKDVPVAQRLAALKVAAGFKDFLLRVQDVPAVLIMSPSGPANGNTKQAFSSVKIPWMLLTGTKDSSQINGADDRLLAIVNLTNHDSSRISRRAFAQSFLYDPFAIGRLVCVVPKRSCDFSRLVAISRVRRTRTF